MASEAGAPWSCDLVFAVAESVDYIQSQPKYNVYAHQEKKNLRKYFKLSNLFRHHKVNTSDLYKCLNVQKYFNKFIIYVQLLNIYVFLMYVYNILPDCTHAHTYRHTYMHVYSFFKIQMILQRF